MSDDKKVKVDTIGTRGSDSKKKLIMVAAAIVVFAILVNAAMVSMTEEKKVKRKDPLPTAVTLTPDGLENESFESVTQTKIKQLEDANTRLMMEIQANKKDIKGLRNDQGEFRNEMNKSLSEVLDEVKEIGAKVESIDSKTGQYKPLPPSDQPGKKLPDVPPPPSFGGVAGEESKSLAGTTAGESTGSGRSVSDSGPTVLRPPKDNIDSNTVAVNTRQVENPYAGWLSSGFLPVTTLTGVHAGTASSAQQNPAPMLMRVQGNVTLPGSAKYDLKGCFINGVSYGDARTHRAITDVSTLSCVDKNNHLVLEESITGYVVDSDGIQGLRGTLIEKRGAVLAKATLAAMLDGLGKAFADAQGTAFNTVTGQGTVLNGQDALQSSGLNAASAGAKTLSDFYLKELERLFPVIEVPPNRKATVIITKGKSLKWHDAGPLFVETKKPKE